MIKTGVKEPKDYRGLLKNSAPKIALQAEKWEFTS